MMTSPISSAVSFGVYEWTKNNVIDVFWIEPEVKEDKTRSSQRKTDTKPLGIEKMNAK
jgi:hypothetical protein